MTRPMLAMAAMLFPGGVMAQLPGTNVTATLRSHVIRAGDTTIVSSSVLVSPASVERLHGFSISVAVPVAQIVSPGPDSIWTATSTFEGHQVAAWFTALPIARGDSTPTLVYKAIGLPVLSTAWLTGDSVLTPWAGDSSDSAPGYEWLDSMSARTLAWGVVSAPTDPGLIAALLQSQADSACSLGWITSSALCSTLHGEAGSGDYAGASAFANSLDSARTGGSAVSDNAYYALSTIADYAVAHIPPPALGAYITADTATAIFTAHVSGGVPSYSYLWEWCAIDCGGDDLRAPVRQPSGAIRPLQVEHGWHDVGTYTASICWTMSFSTLRLTVTDAASTQVLAYFTVPDVGPTCG
jgi:hypothetical protein